MHYTCYISPVIHAFITCVINACIIIIIIIIIIITMKPDIGSESRFLLTPPAFDASVKGGSRRNITMMFGVEKLHCVSKKSSPIGLS